MYVLIGNAVRRMQDDGLVEIVPLDDPVYLAWVAEGNEAGLSPELAQRDAVERSVVLAKVVEIRERVLNRLTGIALREGDGDPALKEACFGAQRALLALTRAPAVVAASRAQELVVAVKSEYASIASTLPQTVRSVFKDVEL